MTTTHTITVLGGTGHTGRRVVRRLRHRGIPVRVGSRAGVPEFHWERPETWAPLLDGAAAAFVAYTPDIAFPGAEETMAALGDEARRLGVGRLVLLSGRGEPGAVRSEEALRSGGVPLTVLRSSFFAQDFSEHFLLDPVLAGVVALPTADVPEPFIDLEDLADVAVEMLCRHQLADTTLELTGPRPLTFAEAAAELSRVTGRQDRGGVGAAGRVRGRRRRSRRTPGGRRSARGPVRRGAGRPQRLGERRRGAGTRADRPPISPPSPRRTADTGVWDPSWLTDRAGA